MCTCNSSAVLQYQIARLTECVEAMLAYANHTVNRDHPFGTERMMIARAAETLSELRDYQRLNSIAEKKS